MKSILVMFLSLTVLTTSVPTEEIEIEIVPICTVEQVSESTATSGLQWATIEINDVMNEEIIEIHVPFGAGVFQEGQKVNFYWLLDFAMIDKTYSETTIQYTLYDGTTWIIEK